VKNLLNLFNKNYFQFVSHVTEFGR